LAIPHNASSRLPDSIPKWETLSADQKKLYARQAESMPGSEHKTAYTVY